MMIKAVYAIVKLVCEFCGKFDIQVPSFEPLDDVLNIFAWARAFVPIDVITSLLWVTACWYTFKLTYVLVKYILKLFF